MFVIADDVISPSSVMKLLVDGMNPVTKLLVIVDVELTTELVENEQLVV